MITKYKNGDDFVWIPVAKESKTTSARAFLPINGLDETYSYGYKASISEGSYMKALSDIQLAYINNESEMFDVKKGSERQYKAKWRHGSETNPPLLGPTKGWVKIPFSRLTSINETELEDALNSSSDKFATLISTKKIISPVIQGLRIKYEQSYSIVVRVFHYSTRLLIA